jgi:hypothetical protein
MTQKLYTAQSIKMEFDLLAAELRTNLVNGDEFRERRRKLYARAHEAIKVESAACSADCPFCAEESAGRLAESEHEKQDNSILTHVGRKVEKVRGIGI